MSDAVPMIGFAGMTHLGLNSAVAAAQKGFSVVCFDPRTELIVELQHAYTPINEPDLHEMLKANATRLHFTHTASDLASCDVVYLSLDVPTDDAAVSDLAPVRTMIDVVNTAISDKALLVILCQVPPGFTRSIARNPMHLYYQVETLIFGQAIKRALYPERYIIGCADPSLPLHPMLAKHLEAYCCPILPMRYESAELAKTAINLFLAASVSTANTLAEVCEKIGADWQEIIPSLRLDQRIGQHAYIAPGLGLSGGNIERDLKTVANIGYEMGAKVSVPLSYIEHSRYRKQWSIRKFFEHYDTAVQPAVVGILGLTYKENTNSLKNSPSIELLEALPDVAIRAYDPVVKTIVTQKTLTLCDSASDVAKGVDILCLMTPWNEFKTMDWNALKVTMRGRVVIDPYRLLAPDVAKKLGLLHCVLGRADN